MHYIALVPAHVCMFARSLSGASLLNIYLFHVYRGLFAYPDRLGFGACTPGRSSICNVEVVGLNGTDAAAQTLITLIVKRI